MYNIIFQLSYTTYIFYALSHMEYICQESNTNIQMDQKHDQDSLRLDLTEPLETKFIDFFDMVTNCGTTEHIEQQYEVFKNLHNCAKVGCFFINSVPLDTKQNEKIHGVSTLPHGIYEYNTNFFIKLCELCNYQIININTDKSTWAPNNQGLCNTVYKKTNNNPFISREDFQQLNKYLKYYQNGSRA